jgi:cobalt/nickel transport protein
MKYKAEIIAGIVIVVFVAIFLVTNISVQQSLDEGEESWAGADAQAEEFISETGYEPWFSPLWEPPSGEIESLFFSLQAAIGALVIGYFFGYYRAKQKKGTD